MRVESETLKPVITISLERGIAFFVKWPHQSFLIHLAITKMWKRLKTQTGFRCLRERGQLESSCQGQCYLKTNLKGGTLRSDSSEQWEKIPSTRATGRWIITVLLLFLPSQRRSRLPRLHRQRGSAGAEKKESQEHFVFRLCINNDI